MPLAVESLSESSGEDQIKNAISKSIASCIKEGKEQKECAEIAFDIARNKTGKSIDYGK